jgi:hypothetical protein
MPTPTMTLPDRRLDLGGGEIHAPVQWEQVAVKDRAG